MVFKNLLGLLIACAASSLLAQTTAPSPEQMIEQLKAPRLRSLRNLSLESVPVKTTGEEALPQVSGGSTATPAPAARPSLSLLIQFEFNSARVQPESQLALSNLSQALQSPELRDSKFAVEGHTDAKGSADYNLKLSQQRALAVHDFLKTKGVDAGRLQASGKGSSELANRAEPFSSENRRVRIVNLD